MIRRLAPIALLLLAACADYGDLKPASTPAELPPAQASLRGLPQAGWPAGEWWKSWGDPQLDDLVGEALAANPDLKLVQARLARAEAVAAGAKANLNFEAGGSFYIQGQHFSEDGLFPPPMAGTSLAVHHLSLDFKYDFDFWGRNHEALAAAISSQETAKADAAAARLALSVAVAGAYIDLDRLWKRRDIAAAQVGRDTENLNLNDARFQAGLADRSGLDQAAMDLDLGRERLAAIDQDMEIARRRLAALLGAGPDRGDAVARPRLNAAAAALPADLPAELLGRRPDIAASRLRVEAAAHAIGEAKAGFYPSINLSSFIGFESLNLAKLLEPDNWAGQILPAVSLPVFYPSRLRANLRVKDADYDIAVETYNATLVKAMRDVATACADWRQGKQRLESQRQAVAAADRALAIAAARHRGGLVDQRAPLSKNRQLLDLRLDEADLEAGLLTASLELTHALGGGYAAPTPPAKAQP